MNHTQQDGLTELHELLYTHPIFSGLPLAGMAALNIERVVCNLGETLQPAPGHLYVMQRGRALEEWRSETGEVCHLQRLVPDAVIGFLPWPISLIHRRRSHYLRVGPSWLQHSHLVEAQREWLLDQVDQLRRRLADTLTLSIVNRIRRYPRMPGEAVIDVAYRIGCSRESASRAIKAICLEKAGESASEHS